MSKRKIGIGSISLLLVIIALIWSYNIFGFCLGDKVLSNFNLPTWSNGNNEQIVNTFSIVTFDNKGQGNHYTAYYSLIFVLPALVLALKNKNHLFAIIGKWMSIIFIALLLISPLLVMI
ncbi:hypothetical protein K040078D81_10620 [Blautia hominis]|uniref:Uncharacterized protein n=1 Tax=Blautia hominis TaxID=2025493 RepID=A0ABQ0B660_9FIRM